MAKSSLQHLDLAEISAPKSGTSSMKAEREVFARDSLEAPGGLLLEFGRHDATAEHYRQPTRMLERISGSSQGAPGQPRRVPHGVTARLGWKSLGAENPLKIFRNMPKNIGEGRESRREK